jgi:pimeloyl-ACP methyl ester carboxylesterase
MEHFRVEVPQAELDDLRRRIDDIRWPKGLPEVGWDRGVPMAYLKDLVAYWRTGYDWRAAEAQLNSFPQFTTNIDGANVYFMHVRSPEPDALPMLITHGWPGSVAEFLEVLGPLTDPRSHGGDPADAFHVVLPSIPGYGFSGPTPEAGWNVPRVAQAWAELMRRLGYDRFIAQGGDFGSGVSLALAMMDPEHVAGVHLNTLVTHPSGDPEELTDLTEDEKARLGRSDRFRTELAGSMKLQGTRPNTMAYSLSDSPVGQLAWIVEKFKDWADAPQAPEDAMLRDRFLTIATIYWLTNTGGSSAQFYYESVPFLPITVSTGRYDPIAAPLGVAIFPHAPFKPVRRFAERDFPTITHWNEYDRGGNFAAMEEPDLFVADVRSFGRSIKDR